MAVKRRKDSCFGLHFDFHATPEKCKNIKLGQNLRAEDIDKLCKTVKPDFIQIDCKGHPGYTSYPTKAGTPAADFAQDTLKIWREATLKNDVALYMHYSGIWDNCWIDAHPEDACMVLNDKGELVKEGNMTSVFGGYLDKLMIPQIKELVSYGVNGIWVDGDCWATAVDYGDNALNAFYNETGIKLSREDINPQNPHYEEYKDFCREAFRKYLRKYVNAAHEADPNFQVASNWAFSEQMPEAVTADVDFLSGDYAPMNSLNGALFGGRIMAGQNKPWDFMAWGFRTADVDKAKGIKSRNPKNPIQLMQEAAAIMSLGGGFQIYLTQSLDTSPILPYALRMASVGDFCRARKDFCYGVRAVPNVAIFNSTYDHYLAMPGNALFGNRGTYTSISGWTQLLAEAGHSFEILEEHNLFDRINNYGVVVCPEIINRYTEETKQKLLDYAANGGNLVLAGIKTLEQFKEKAGIDFAVTEFTPNALISVDGENIDEYFCETAEILTDGETLATSYNNLGDCLPGIPEADCAFAKAIDFGKGKIIAIGGDLGSGYFTYKTVSSRKLAEKLFDFYVPTARIDGACKYSINTTEKDGRLLIQILNINGEHSNDKYLSFDEITPLCNLRLTVRTDKKPEKVTLQPEGINLDFTYKNGILSTTVNEIKIHGVVEII